AIFVAVYVFCDVLANMDEFTEDKTLTAREVLVNMADYYGHNLPLYYAQLGGILLALAAAATFALMLWNNELVALVAAGVPLQRLALPPLVCSVVLVAAWMANSEVVVPRFGQQIARQRDDLSGARQIDVQCVRDDRNAILTAQELHLHEGRLRGVYIVEAPTEAGALRRLIRADAAYWEPQRRTWRLDRGARQVLAIPGIAELSASMRWEPLDEYPFTLAPAEILLRQSSEWTDLMGTRQMTALLRSRNLPNLTSIARAMNIRVTQPLLAWILMLLAFPFFLTREPSNVLVAGGKALLLCGACFGLMFLAHNAGDLGPLRAAALPVVVFGPIAVLHLANVKT
ncbi:MAG: LptF/LptG family permease, partial [Planctomycetota bacterium]